MIFCLLLCVRSLFRFTVRLKCMTNSLWERKAFYTVSYVFVILMLVLGIGSSGLESEMPVLVIGSLLRRTSYEKMEG